MVLSMPTVAWPQDEVGEEAETSTSSKAKRHFERFAETARELDVRTLDADEKLQWSNKPLMRFSSEGTVFGSVFIWKDAGQRLAMIGTIGSIPIRTLDYEFVELHLLKPVPIQPFRLPGRARKQWLPDVSALALRPVLEAPEVAATERGRMVHMRAIARQFQSVMIEDERKNQLRLLPQPLYRYDQPTMERDGALFAFVWDKGTDPELLLRLETQELDGKVVWHYQPVRFTWRALKLSHRDKQVWQAEELIDRDAPTQQTPYVTGLTEVIP